MNRLMSKIILASILLSRPALAQMQVGVAKSDITPVESVPLAGYGGKTRMSQEVVHPIWLKAIALRDEMGQTSVMVTADLVGLSDKMVDIIAKNAFEKYQLPRERLILNTSHNHSCPVTEDVLWIYYEFNDQERAAKDRYTQMVYQTYDEVIAAALKDLSPAEINFEHGLAGIAVNRRRSRGPESRAFGGQIDQDVPVLAVKSGGQLRAILFGYSCHTTALGGLSISGDYAGFAQIELEKQYPGSLAMFVQNCGGDANPLPRIRGNEAEAVKLTSMYGHILAESVKQVIAAPMQSITGPIKAVMGETELFLKPGLSLAELQKKLPGLTGMAKTEIEYQINQ